MLARTPRVTEHDAQIPATESAPTFDLSVRQLLASAGAAVTAAILGSRLGVAGTLIGAALASAISMIASAIYSHSLAAAQYRMRQAKVSQQLEAEASTIAIPIREQAWGMVPTPAPRLSVATMPYRIPAAPKERRMPRWAIAGLGTLAACAVALVAITGIEVIRGTALSGGASGGLSVLGGHSSGTTDTTPGRTVPGTDSSSATSSSSPASATASTSDGVTSTVTVTSTDPASSSSASSTSTTTDPSATSTSPTASSAESTPSAAAVADQTSASPIGHQLP
jgi:hypothetical protein